jgi:hypothetical protein
MNPINSEIIDETTKKFADDPEVAKRLLWWLRNGHSCERWFQFEWAYKLQSVLERECPDTYSIGCERKYVDIVIYKKPFKQELALNQQNVFAGIEIKWCGNWATASSIADTEKDFSKIRETLRYSYPALALSVWLFATPFQNNDQSYSWIGEQIKNEKINRETLDDRLTSLKYDFRTKPSAITGLRAFGELEIFCVGLYNERAKSI